MKRLIRFWSQAKSTGRGFLQTIRWKWPINRWVKAKDRAELSWPYIVFISVLLGVVSSILTIWCLFCPSEIDADILENGLRKYLKEKK